MRVCKSIEVFCGLKKIDLYFLIRASESFYLPFPAAARCLTQGHFVTDGCSLCADRLCDLLVKGKKLSHHLPPNDWLVLIFFPHIHKRLKR